MLFQFVAKGDSGGMGYRDCACAGASERAACAAKRGVLTVVQ
jgi:hypothetical protein